MNRITTQTPTDFTRLTGLWRSRGYGQILDIRNDGYTLYEVTKVSCLPVFGGTLDELAEHYVDLEVSPQGRAFSARRAAGVTRVRFRRMNALPRTAETFDPQRRHDPLFNFAVLWHTFAEHYALFDVRGVDWQAIHNRYHREIEPRTPSSELFDIFADMLASLRDGHVHLHAPHRRFNAGEEPLLFHRLARELDKAEDSRDVDSYLAELREWLRETIHDDYLAERSRHAGNRLLEWGRLNDATGYLAIRAMAGICGRVGRPREDFAAVDAAMEGVTADLADCETIVLDLRSNGGGYDGVALRLAGYFIDRKRLAFTKAARRGEGYTGKQRIYVEPSGGTPFTGQLAVLTSGLTASAAEVFILALLQHPRLTLIGEPTQGILSDALERHLPNGWFVTLSNEVYRAYDEALYEDTGIPPHIEIPFLHQRDRERGRDRILDHALNIAG